ncbi:DMT family transporter [Microbacterium sediminicola]
MSAASVTDQFTDAFRDPAILTGIPMAVLGAIFMSLGAQYQHRGVQKVERVTGRSGGTGLDLHHLLNLLKRPSWLSGTLMLALAIVCQLAALSVAPLILVQPLGAISLVITTLLNARVSGHAPTRQSIRAIVAAVGGIFIFVTIAAFFATERPVTQTQIIIILGLLGVTIVAFAVLWVLLRSRSMALLYIVASGVLYGFVATLAKVVLSRIRDNNFDWLTLLSMAALIAAVLVGAYFVQTAYSLGPPDLVIAGLTVIDPIIAVVIGLTVLQEAEKAPFWAFIGFAAAGALAVYGVISLARNHPQIISDSQELPIVRGSDAEDEDGEEKPSQ